MKASIKTAIFGALCTLSVSCDDYLEVKNHSGIPADNLITTVDNAQIVLNGAYDGFYGTNLFYFRIYYYLLLATNELKSMKVDEELSPLENFSYYDGAPFVAGYWKDLYSIVSRANDACTKIYQLRNSGTLTGAENQELDRMIGECNFLRAWAYFYLSRSFGDKLPSHPQYNPAELGVPILDSLIVVKQQLLIPRNTLGECWDKVLRDFEAAYNRLPAAWGNDKLGAATQGAAAGYLGQVYMYLQDYSKAKEWFEKAMQAGNYRLTDDYGWNFDAYHENNSESVFEVQFQATASDADLASYMWRRLGPDGVGGGFGMVGVSPEWVNKFSTGYELTQEIYDGMKKEIDDKRRPSESEIILREVLKAYQPAIGIPVFSQEDFYDLYTGDWNALADAINPLLSLVDAGQEPGWGTVNNKYVQQILTRCRAADPRMYTSFYVPGRDSVALNWAATEVKPYSNSYYGFKKYIPYNAVASWQSSDHLPYTDGSNSINQRIFRLADLYLQYAEACYRSNDPDNAGKYLNKVRRRAWKMPFEDADLTSPES
ncbi:MAG: RagB/SusD family nutrient uptake outer membrane protein, partial [Dysgonamonadaceae bacterium]|nr:RagB/SusD family nutrient uptake outer membrane protein [Dysgonamonadaceae bacterium]